MKMADKLLFDRPHYKLSARAEGYLNNIRSEPGEWTTRELAEDFGVRRSATLISLQLLEKRGLIRQGEAKAREGSRGSVARPWYPAKE